jgi:hypothetical protein
VVSDAAADAKGESPRALVANLTEVKINHGCLMR